MEGYDSFCMRLKQDNSCLTSDKNTIHLILAIWHLFYYWNYYNDYRVHNIVSVYLAIDNGLI